MKLMSFAFTIAQMRAHEQIVTRRMNWWQDKHGRRLLHVGDEVQPVEQTMGLAKGQHVVKIGCAIEIMVISRELVRDIVNWPNDMRAEGFPLMDPDDFISMFCHHNRCYPGTEISRISFMFKEPLEGCYQ